MLRICEGNRSKQKPKPIQEPEFNRVDYAAGFISPTPNIIFDGSELNTGKYKFDAEEEDLDKEREKHDSSPLRTSHLAESVRENISIHDNTYEKNRNPTGRLSHKQDKENISTNDSDLNITDTSIFLFCYF
jgi:hypothetical protein